MTFRSRARRAVSASCFVTTLLLASAALADKVAVLPFVSAAAATSADLDAARAATRAAVTALSHTQPTESEMLTAQMSAQDGVADTGEEYRAAGRASTSDWTVMGHVEAHGPTYRLELDVCQISSGRIESLAREITPAQAAAQIGEMLALLVRPEGLNNAPIPWERGNPLPPAPPPKEVPPPTPPPSAPPPSAPPAARHTYAEGHSFGIGVFTSLLSAFSRPANAQGSPTSGLFGLSAMYAFSGAPGLELRADFDWSYVGPGSLAADGGIRYAFPIAPTLRLFLGPEVEAGGFFANGADKTPRALVSGGAFASIGIGERVQIEVAGDVSYAAGSPSLALGGGTLRGVVRF
jgi:hypothetical protein